MKIIDRFPQIANKVTSVDLRNLVDNIEVVDFNGPDTTINLDHTVVVANRIDTNEALSVFKNPKVQHLIQSNRQDFFREIMTSCMIINNFDQFWENPIPFFVDNFEGDPNYKSTFRSVTYNIHSTDEQAKLLKSLKEFLHESPQTKKLWASVVLIADELLANAFFNGPLDQYLKPLNRKLPRNQSIKTDETIRFFIAHDNSRLMLGCEDPFGSVNRDDLVRKLGRVYSTVKDEIDLNDVSAGLGCKMMIDCSTGFYLMVKNLKKTLVFCTLDIGRREVETALDPKHIHLCFR